MKTVILDGVPTEISDEGAAAIVKMKTALIGAAAIVSAQNGEIDALKSSFASEIAAANAHTHDTEALDAAVALRISVIEAAKLVQGTAVDATGKSEAEIRRAAVTIRLGDSAMADKDDSYIQAAFETLLAVSTGDQGYSRAGISSQVLAKDVIKAYASQVTSTSDTNRAISGIDG